MSGSIISVSEHAMDLHRRIENIELAIAGRNNQYAAVRQMVKAEDTEPV
jgi:hypothetical protein